MSNALHVTAPEGLPFVETTREFDFPVEAVFGAFADPELFTQWNGPRYLEMTIQRHDFSTGGGYQYTHRDPSSGEEYGFRGVFHVVRENDFVIQTFEFDGVPDVVTIESMTFERLDGGRTRITGHSTFPSVEARDGIIEHGMEIGMREGFERLGEVLAAR
jgi:uncharacterized protein YndB with AHSA1/START domain